MWLWAVIRPQPSQGTWMHSMILRSICGMKVVEWRFWQLSGHFTWTHPGDKLGPRNPQCWVQLHRNEVRVEKPEQMGNPSRMTPEQQLEVPWAPASPSPDLVLSLTLLSSGVGGRGFFEAETRKTEKENEHETECAHSWRWTAGGFSEKRGPKENSRRKDETQGLGFLSFSLHVPDLIFQEIPETSRSPSSRTPGKA